MAFLNDDPRHSYPTSAAKAVITILWLWVMSGLAIYLIWVLAA